MTDTAYYQLAAGIDVVPMGGDAFLSVPYPAVRVEGSMAGLSRLVFRSSTAPIDRRTVTATDQMCHRRASAGLDRSSCACTRAIGSARCAGTRSSFLAFVADIGRPVLNQRACFFPLSIFVSSAWRALALEPRTLGIGACILADSFKAPRRAPCSCRPWRTIQGDRDRKRLPSC